MEEYEQVEIPVICRLCAFFDHKKDRCMNFLSRYYKVKGYGEGCNYFSVDPLIIYGE